MSEDIITRLRYYASTQPNICTPVFPGDVIEVVDTLQQRIERLEKALREIHWFISNKDGDWYYYMTKDNMLDVIARWVDEALKEGE